VASFFSKSGESLSPLPLKKKSREYVKDYSIFIWESHLSSRLVRFKYLSKLFTTQSQVLALET
jgi:hypothetical protein